MPNLNAFEGKSINTIYFDDLIESEDRKIIGSIFSSIGQNIIFDDELMIDQSTAISGSGPAYVFYLMQSFIEAATKIGLPLEDAKKLVYETFAGACATAKKNLDDLDKLIENVSSKGGTTEAAIKSFDESNIKEIFNQAVKNAYNRALEINQENKN
jgi:pyrroline-5-carboxylate reductase